MDKTLILSCCQSKLQGTHKAIDLYQGKAFKLIRKENLLDTVDVWILSAELGLIHSSEPISWYELKMNETRSIELIDQGIPSRYRDYEGEPSVLPTGEINIYGGKLYRDVLNSYFDKTIELIGRNRGIGDHFSALLKFVNENKPQGVLPI
mgnify:CR=1 FL=1|jgi:hypothetical protein|tara:strand:- start:1611 stop:2060 length:450 start_codon:yes stop_codon:yes gene_type:complete